MILAKMLLRVGEPVGKEGNAVRRVVLTVASLAVVGVVLAGCSSGGSSSPQAITCTGLSGTLTGTTKLSGCTGGDTGGSSTNLGAELAGGGTITWSSGNTTTVGKPTLATVSDSVCPTVSGTTVGKADAITAPVTADKGNGIKIPGMFTGTACLYANDDVGTVSPGFKIS